MAWRNSPVARNGKFIVHNETYAEKFYPLYCSGSGYLMRGPVPQLLFEETRKHPFIGIEDVFFTGIVAEGANISRISKPGFFIPTLPRCKDEAREFLTSGEYKNPQAGIKIRRAWRRFLISNSTECCYRAGKAGEGSRYMTACATGTPHGDHHG